MDRQYGFKSKENPRRTWRGQRVWEKLNKSAIALEKSIKFAESEQKEITDFADGLPHLNLEAMIFLLKKAQKNVADAIEEGRKYAD